jgi:secretion/DNA translocation related CpaE-like protein
VGRRSVAGGPSQDRAGAPASGSPSDRAPVLLVSRDPGLQDRLAGLGQAAGVSLLTVADVGAASAVWSSARLVLVGPDAAGAARERPPQRRRGVVVVALGAAEPELWRDAVALGAEQVAVLPEAEPWLLDQLVDAGSGTRAATVVGVVGGRGGAGATTLATALAMTGARQGHAPILVDLDHLAGGLDLVLGAEHDPGLRWPELCSVRGRMQPGLLSRGLPFVDGVRLLSWGRDDDEDAGPQAVSAVLAAATRESDLVVLDLPRRFDDVAVAALRACDTVLLIVPAEVRAAAAAARVQAAVEAHAADLRLVVRGPSPTGLTAESIADSLQLPLAGELRPEPGLAVALDRGLAPPLRPRGSLAALCRRLTVELRAA